MPSIFKMGNIKRLLSHGRTPCPFLFKAVITAVVLSLASSAWSLELADTLFAQAGRQYGLSPALLYAVALVESARDRGRGSVSPWPWTLRGPRQAYYAASKQDAIAVLQQYRQRYGQAIDIGLMQINLYWHGKRVAAPDQLLDPEQNLMLGAQLLVKAIRSAPQDFALGIGRYHHWRDPLKARRYGQRVLAVLRQVHTLATRQEDRDP